MPKCVACNKKISFIIKWRATARNPLVCPHCGTRQNMNTLANVVFVGIESIITFFVIIAIIFFIGVQHLWAVVSLFIILEIVRVVVLPSRSLE